MAHRVAADVVDDAVARGVLAGEDRGPVGRAKRRSVEGIRETRALGGEAVDVRRLHVRMPGGAGLVEAQVVDEDDNQIRLHSLPVKLKTGTDHVFPPRETTAAVIAQLAPACRRAGETAFSSAENVVCP